MGIRRPGTKGYEEVDGVNVSSPPSANNGNGINNNLTVPEFELASVSVVPDGERQLHDVFFFLAIFRKLFNFSHCLTILDTYTVAQAVNALGFGWFQVKLSLFVGLCWMSDSMEMTILSVLGPALHCDWGISRYQQAMVTTIVFLGMMLSSTFWGSLSDKYGRKPVSRDFNLKHARAINWVFCYKFQALTLCGILLFLYGLLSSVAPSLGWLLLLRGLVGFAIGAVPQSVTLYAEFLPTKQRAKCVVLLDCFWALGACFEVVLAMAVVPTLGWRWLLGLSAAPLFVFACLTPWLPESARYHVSCGQNDKALATLEKVSSWNIWNEVLIMLINRFSIQDRARQPKTNAVGSTRGREYAKYAWQYQSSAELVTSSYDVAALVHLDVVCILLLWTGADVDWDFRWWE